MGFKYSLVFVNNGSDTLAFAVPGNPKNRAELQELLDPERFDNVRSFVSGAPGTVAVANMIHWNGLEDLDLNEPTPLELLWIRSLTVVPKEDECAGDWTVNGEEIFPAEPADHSAEQETSGAENVKPEETEPELPEPEEIPPVAEQPAAPAEEEPVMEETRAEEPETEEPVKTELEPVPAEPEPVPAEQDSKTEPGMEPAPDPENTEPGSPHNCEECHTGAEKTRKLLKGLAIGMVSFIAVCLALKKKK